MHMFPGFAGLATVIGAALICGTACYSTKKYEAYNLDPAARPGAFEPLLQKYLRLAEFVIGLATGSIVLLVGSSALHGQSGQLPWFYASPLLVLAGALIFGVLFMFWLIFKYEDVQHGNAHTRLDYSLSQMLGFTSLLCFCTGYVWLILVVAAK